MHTDEHGWEMAVVEYLIRRTDGEWFDLHRDDYDDVFLRPESEDAQVAGVGDYRFCREGIEIAVNYEDSGLHIILESDAVVERFDSWLCGILKRLETKTGQSGELVWL